MNKFLACECQDMREQFKTHQTLTFYCDCLLGLRGSTLCLQPSERTQYSQVLAGYILSDNSDQLHRAA